MKLVSMIMNLTLLEEAICFISVKNIISSQFAQTDSYSLNPEIMHL